jgi:hypothetical protein
MAIRDFLKPLSVVFAALASASASADVKPTSIPAPLVPETTGTAADNTMNAIAPGTSRDISFRQGGDLFTFSLARSESGDFVAYHQSHSSHESHSSHSSHRSHYSGR